MKTYGKSKKHAGKIHSADKCGICGNHNDPIVKGRERRNNKLKVENIDIEIPEIIVGQIFRCGGKLWVGSGDNKGNNFGFGEVK